MFKTMDGVSVYDKQDVDGIADAINADVSQNTSDITNLKTGVNALQTSKADKSELNAKADATDLTETNTRVSNLENNKAASTDLSDTNNRVAALENSRATNTALSETNTRVTALESGKANKSEVESLVQDAVNAKVNTITSDINHIVDNAVDDAMEDYDTSTQVTQKINTAIGNIPSGPTAMTTTEATAIINNYF